jgi:hypothetical protein
MYWHGQHMAKHGTSPLFALILSCLPACLLRAQEDSQRLQPLIDMFTRLAKRLEEMADGTHTQLMKQLAKQRDEGTLPNSLLQLLPDTQWEGPWTHALPVALTAAGGSVFDQHYEEQVGGRLLGWEMAAKAQAVASSMACTLSSGVQSGSGCMWLSWLLGT